MEDVEAVVDLRHLSTAVAKAFKTFFWQECSKYIEEGVVDDQRHQKVTHLATAISVPDRHRRYPEGTPFLAHRGSVFNCGQKTVIGIPLVTILVN